MRDCAATEGATRSEQFGFVLPVVIDVDSRVIAGWGLAGSVQVDLFRASKNIAKYGGSAEGLRRPARPQWQIGPEGQASESESGFDVVTVTTPAILRILSFRAPQA